MRFEGYSYMRNKYQNLGAGRIHKGGNKMENIRGCDPRRRKTEKYQLRNPRTAK